MKKLLIVVAMLGAMLSLTSCNMVRGAGKDIENAADAVQDAVN